MNPRAAHRGVRPLARWAGALGLAAAGLLPVSCGNSESLPPPPPADISVPPGLHVQVGVSEPLVFSGAALKGDAATPLFRGRITPRSGQSLTAPSPPEGSRVRLRFAEAPVPERGEDMTWIRGEGGLSELPGTAAEFVYSGGEQAVQVVRDASGRLSVVPAGPAPAGAK